MAPRPQSTLVEESTAASDTNTAQPTLEPTPNGLTNGLLNGNSHLLHHADLVSNKKTPECLIANSDPIVISGMGGRYPESESVDEFAANLYAKVDMITLDERRWPTDLYDMNHRMGKLKTIDKFDGAFFGWRNRLGDSIDPQGRILLETAYEAIADAGVNPQTLRGSRTGVYVGHSTIGMPDGLPTTIDPTVRTSITDSMSWIQGTAKSMYANRLSYFFDFRGPSMTIDTACSSSMVALDVAVTDLRAGKIDQAVVGGTNVNLQPFTNYFYQKLGFNAPDGLSKVWDADADGFVRGETVACLFLQREPVAKRIYARILHSRTNIDGYKATGMFFPSSDGQLDLLVTTAQEAGVDPNSVTYFEAHGTGTKAGDFQEASAIHRAYCAEGRKSVLPIGLLKSNIGHGEGASGVASLTKVVLAFEHGCIPANLNLREIKANIKELTLLAPITENLPYVPGIAGVNSFGVGGVNGHALLEPNYKVVNAASSFTLATPTLARLVPLHGRTKEAVEHLMTFMETNPNKVTPDFLALIADVFKYRPMLNSAGFPYRGTLLIKASEDGGPNLSYTRSPIEFINAQYRNQLVFFYSGIGGGPVSALAKHFTAIEPFAVRLHQLAAVLKPHGINLVDLLTVESGPESSENSSLTAKFVSTTAFQVLLTDLLTNQLELVPEAIVGHSFGEIAAAYAQGYLSAEEALLVAFHRGQVLEQARSEIPVGLMAAVGLSASEVTARLPEKPKKGSRKGGVFVACNNAPKLVTVSGEANAVRAFVSKLAEEGVFVRELDSAQYPLHTPYLEVVKERLLGRLEAVFGATRGGTTVQGKTKMAKSPVVTNSSESLKWVSTCQPPETMEELHAASRGEVTSTSFTTRLAHYFLENLLSPVAFTSALNRLTEGAIILEFAGRELFEKVITGRSGSSNHPTTSFTYLPLMRTASRGTPEALVSTLSTLYRVGFNPSVERLYPAVRWPVARGTQSLSSLFKWEHKETYLVKRYPEYFNKATAADLVVEIDPENPEFDYLYHHVIDGKTILPGTASLVFAWKRYADSRAIPWNRLPVLFEDVQLRRPVFLDRNSKTVLRVRLLEPTGEFRLLENGNLVATGTIRELKSPEGFALQHMLSPAVFERLNAACGGMTTVVNEDIYKDYRVRGYEYGPKFRGIVDFSTDFKRHSYGSVRWAGHMIAYLDSLLQMGGPVVPVKELIVPVVFSYLKIDPNILFKEIEANNISSSEVATEVEVGELLADSSAAAQVEEELENEELTEMRSKMQAITGEADYVKNADAVLRAYCNVDQMMIVAPGVEIHNVTGASIGRKVHPAPVTVESHEFVAHFEEETRGLLDEEEVNNGSDRASELAQYEALCQWEFSQLRRHFGLQNETEEEIEPEKTLKERFLGAKEGTSALLKVLTTAVAELTDENNNSVEKEFTFSSSTLSEEERLQKLNSHLKAVSLKLANCGPSESSETAETSEDLQLQLSSYFHADLTSSTGAEERLIRPLVDLVAENFVPAKDLTVVQLATEPQLPLALKVDRYLATSTIFKLNIDYNLVHCSGSSSPLTSTTETPSGEQMPYNFTSTSLEQWPPSIGKDQHQLQLKSQPALAVIVDEPMAKLNQKRRFFDLEDGQFWSSLAGSITLVASGFALVLLRTSLSPVERQFYEALFEVDEVPSDEALKRRVEAVKEQAAMINFLIIGSKASHGHLAMLFRFKPADQQQPPAPVFSTVVFEGDEKLWLETVQAKLRAVNGEGEEGEDSKDQDKNSPEEEQIVWLLADQATLPGALGFFNCLRKEPGGRQFRLLFNLDHQDPNSEDALRLFNRHSVQLTKLDLAVNIFKAGSFGSYRHLSRNLLTASKMTTEYHLNIGAMNSNRNDLGSLAMVDSTGERQIGYLPKRGGLPANVPTRERKYAVYSAALNFRDVMLASGRLFPPVQLLTQNCMIGTEFAGRDLETGERVFGIHHGGSFATTLHQLPLYVRPIPPGWSYDDAVGAVTVYFTVWYGLLYKARLEPGSTILIHSAAGGVGQAALHVAKAYNCTIFATAGSAEKREWLAEHFGLSKDHIYSSRDTAFEKEIREQTDGAGVKYIVNSLIGEQLDASIRLVADNGHFIELAKAEMQNNKRIGTFAFLRNLSYHGVAIEQQIFKETHRVGEFYDWMLANCEVGREDAAVKPITSHVFSAENAVTAFRFMTSGKHKGKIVIRFREEDELQTSKTGQGAIVPAVPRLAQTRTYFDPYATYIVVGGCGGVGIELTHWLVKKGAKRVVLTSRSATRTPYQALSLGTLAITGSVFQFFTNELAYYSEDLSTEEGVRKLISHVQKEFGPVGGIFHLAVSLSDGLLGGMKYEENWRKTVDSKATLAVNLDVVSRELCPGLPFFVCLSSVSSGRGNVGQTNYGYANSVLERIVERRRADGLHGLAVQYGPIGDVGLLSELDNGGGVQAFASVQLQRIISCLEVLNRAMASEHAVVSSLVFAERSGGGGGGAGAGSTSEGMLHHLWSALGVDPETLPDHVTLGELGMESMFAVEMQQTLEVEYGVRLSLAEIQLITVGELKNTDKERMFEHLSKLKEFKSYLLSVKLVLSATPTEQLNSVTEGEPIFMLPGVLGVFGGMRSFAEKITFPVVALTVTKEVNSRHVDVKAAATYYSALLRKLYPNIRRYNLLGFDYGALVAMKMARKGLPCRVAVVDLKQNSRAVNLDAEGGDEQQVLYEQLIDFVIGVLLAGSFKNVEENRNTKERLLRAVHVEVTFEGKVRAIAAEIQKLRDTGRDKVKAEEVEEVISGALRRAQAMFEYDRRMAAKTAKKGGERLVSRLLGKLAKAQGRFLVLKDGSGNSGENRADSAEGGGLLSNYFRAEDLMKLGTEEQRAELINLRQQETLTLNSSAELLNRFFASKAF